MNWAVVPSVPTLMVSDTGRVIRLASSRRKGKGWQTFPELELKCRPIGAGYSAVGIKEQGRVRTLYVHRLVAEAFLGKPSDANEVNHIDGNKSNNNLKNLEWSTHSANLQHAYANGLHPGRSLTPDQIRTIRLMLTEGKPMKTVAVQMGVSTSAINHIKQGRSWRWLS